VPLERRLIDDFALEILLHRAFRPQHRPRRNTVDSNIRAQFARQRTRQHREPRLRNAVHRVSLERAQSVDIDHVDYEPALLRQAGRRRLREKQRRFQVAADEIIPLRKGDLPDRGRVKTRRIVD